MTKPLRSRRPAVLRSTVAAVTGAGLILSLAACAPSSDGGSGDAGELLVYDGGGEWGEAQRQAFFEPFEEETGIRIVTVPADSPTAMRTSIEAGSPSMDVINVPGADYAAWVEAGLLEQIDFDSWTTVDPEDFAPYATEDYGVPSLIFAAQIAYDADAVSEPIETWADFWDVDRIPGTRALGTGTILSTGIFEAALLADGVPADELYPLDIDRAFAKLDEIKPSILKFWESGAESVQLLADAQIVAGAAWNGRVAALTQEFDNIAFSWDGAILSSDYWGITAGAANPEAAQQFIEFASQPERLAEFASLVTYAPGNLEAYDFIDADRQELLPTAPAYVDSVIPQDTAFWASDSGNGTPWSEEIITRWQKWLSE